MLNKIVFIQVTLEATDDANTVFSKLNYEGVKLSLSDLVRNEVISRVPDNCKDALDRFYETTWKPFEKAFPTNSFDQYITIYSFIKFKGSVSKSRAFPELQKAWIGIKPNLIVSDMNIYADLYCALVKYNPLKNIHIDVGERVRRFSLMPKTTVTWPYIIELLNASRNGLAGKADTLKCLLIVESFLVRRAIVGLEPTGLHAVFKGLWIKAGADPVKLKEKIVTGTIRCPNDQTITETLSTGDMYSRKITKYLLTQRELHFNHENGYDNATDDFTVEHVLPQNLIKEWALVFTKEEHKALLHTIGNLVPLTKGQNGRVKDQDWISKKNFIKGSNWKITQTAAAVKSWDKSQILKRAKAFASVLFSK
ncbi:HNH endonuclease family protein [Pseudomonas syringae pv. actinidiae]|nr:HNH endonuclease family protein [Pseudomonas syringae pv. actinidiae]MDU8095155.1 HNH endonuclease family protein [Pseudomonas syringae pv. actinidiae]MDU8138263.1 HNH endonuclease family protein [Pseudomonas syringae pv. actinidiae]